VAWRRQPQPVWTGADVGEVVGQAGCCLLEGLLIGCWTMTALGGVVIALIGWATSRLFV